MILYSTQTDSVVHKLKNGEVYTCTSCIYFSSSSSEDKCFASGYKYIMKHMTNLPGYKDGIYPIWLTPDKDEALSYISSSKDCLLILDIPDEYFLLTNIDLYTINCMTVGVEEIAEEDKDLCLDISECEPYEIQATTWLLKPEWLLDYEVSTS